MHDTDLVVNVAKETAMRNWLVGAIALIALALCEPPAAQAQALADTSEAHACFGKDRGNRIDACTQFLQIPGLSPREQASAYAMRALELSLLGRYADAIRDYDSAIRLNPNFPVALNNRAWAYYRSGNVKAAWPDVQQSLKLDPFSGHAHDTRAHLHHAEGNEDAAYRDYRAAMHYGGRKMVRLYQCGLQAQGHYNGPLSGILTEPLLAALKVCVSIRTCDPLPPDEECKPALS